MDRIKRELTDTIAGMGFRESAGMLINAALKLGYSFSIWKLPLESVFTLVLSVEKPLSLSKPELEDLEEGFIMAPFRQDEATWITADLTLTSESPHIAISPTLAPEKVERIEHLIELAGHNTSGYPKFHIGKAGSPGLNKEKYREIVRRSIKEIEKGSFEKVVPARSLKVPCPSDRSLLELFFEMSEQYENAFTYLLSSPPTGTWMGATPELLISTEDNRYFETVSLAGTQQIQEKLKLSQVSWTQKEIEEQAMVSRYIINCFKKIRLREFEEHGPKTVLAGNLMHLKTTFRVDMQETNFPQLGSVMLELLHPTSAVCGLPKKPALAFISENESLDRSYYSGYLGPVNIKNATRIYVNLRSLQYEGETLILYAGAGITEDSEPDQELEETEMKFRTLLNVIERSV